MNDQEFLQAFEGCTLTSFSHRDHIRMAWLYLRANDYDTAADKIRTGIRRFAAVQGATQKYHETITQFWIRLVYHAISLDAGSASFESFIAAYSHLLDSSLLSRHYSVEALQSSAARQQWVEPDLQPLPDLIS